MGILSILIGLAISTAILWFTIKLIAKRDDHTWKEMFFWTLFFTLISNSRFYAMILSSDPDFLLIVRVISIGVIGALLYFLLGRRLGIMNAVEKLKIVGVYVGIKVALGLLRYL